MSAPRPVYDRWRDADGTHIGDGCRVEQVEVAKDHGALPSRLGKRGQVVGRSASNRLYVLFDGEDREVSIRPHLVRVLTAEEPPLPQRSAEHIIAALRVLAAEQRDGRRLVVPAHGARPMAEESTGDPWIDAYLRCRAAVHSGEVTTLAEVAEYARELRRALPTTAPSVPAATFITADIDIAFPESSSAEFRGLLVGLWRPDFTR